MSKDPKRLEQYYKKDIETSGLLQARRASALLEEYGRSISENVD